MSAIWIQRKIRLQPQPRGFHLVTAEVLEGLPELREVSVGILHLLIQHTSASLTLRENASPEVRRDFEAWFSRAVPEGAPYWTHTGDQPPAQPLALEAIVDLGVDQRDQARLGPVLDEPREFAVNADLVALLRLVVRDGDHRSLDARAI